jgi:hypothetical protein
VAFTFTDQPRAAERKRKAAERRKAERERMRQQRRAYQEQQRAREEAYWSRFTGGSNGRSSSSYTQSPGIAMADQALALEIINAGYRILSLRNHPDHGGSHDKMVEINRVGDALRALAGGKK